MGIARNLEKRLERLADGLSAAIFRGKMQPVDLANRLVRQADLLVVETESGPEIPNFFDVTVSEVDIDPAADTGALGAELAHTLTMTAADRGWRTRGPISVRIGVDGSVGRGSIKCAPASSPAELPAWGELGEHRGDRSFTLRDNRVVVGRSSEADIEIDIPEVSRQHAVLFREGGRLWLADLASANGSQVNGIDIGGEPIEVGSGDMLSFGPITFALRVG